MQNNELVTPSDVARRRYKPNAQEQPNNNERKQRFACRSSFLRCDTCWIFIIGSNGSDLGEDKSIWLHCGYEASSIERCLSIPRTIGKNGARDGSGFPSSKCRELILARISAVATFPGRASLMRRAHWQLIIPAARRSRLWGPCSGQVVDAARHRNPPHPRQRTWEATKRFVRYRTECEAGRPLV